MRLIYFLVFFTPIFSVAQGPACSTVPGMTPSTAIAVCGTTVFTQTAVNNCTGPNMPHSGCVTDVITSNNSFWYKFHCYQSGTLGFIITPAINSNDFDWEMTDITGHNPNDVFTDATLQVSYNLFGSSTGNNGATGCSNAGNSDMTCSGEVGLRFNRMPAITVGHDYLLMVTNWNGVGGYNLDFSGGTAVISDPIPPHITNIDAGCNSINISFSKDVLCTSVTNSGSEFLIQPGNFTVNNISSDCSNGVNSIRGMTLNLPAYLPPGNYQLIVNNGTDGNSFLDACGNAIAAGTAFPFIVKKPLAFFSSNSPVCAGNPMSFISNSDPIPGNTIGSWHWDFGDISGSTLSNPSHTYATGGTFTVKHWIVNSQGCFSDTATQLVTVHSLPTASFTAMPVGGFLCAGADILFTSTSLANSGAINNWSWDLGDGTLFNLNNGNPFTHAYVNAGTYTVTLVVTTDAGCISIIYSQQVIIHPLPVANFIHTPACLPNGLVTFTNTTNIANASPLVYAWNFGDPSSGTNNTSILTNPTHYFSTAGPFTVSLLATSQAGCENSISLPIIDVYAQAHADFTVNPENCLNDATLFTSTSDPLAGNTIASWHWDFGDAQGSFLQNPSHTYATAGTYTIKHWIVTGRGCNSDTMTKTIVINPLPTAQFSVSAPVCETRQINFTDASLANVGTIASWQWNFGDATSATQQNPTHIYATAGSYNASLVGVTNKGCTSAAFTLPVNVHPQPILGFINPEVCLTDASAQFIDTSKVTLPDVINSWLWNFGDPGSGILNSSILQNPTHTYHAVGLYAATLTATTDKGCTQTISQQFTVNGDIPAANFNPLNPTTLCANDSIAIQDASTVNFGNITTIEIYWDAINQPLVLETDINPLPGKIYKHLYPLFNNPLTKTFTIRYRAYSGATCVNDKIKTIVVNAAPLLQFTPIPPTCLDALPFQITQATEIAGVPGTGIFTGPGISAAGIFNPAITGPGTFQFLYTYTSTAAGCTDTISNAIIVWAPPVSDFTVSAPVCETKNIDFTSTASTPVGSLTTWTWNFGDGSPSLIRNSASTFTHTFQNAGTYTVSLIVTTSNGCISIATTKQVVVKPQPKPNFSFTASTCLPNALVQFTDLSTIADGTQNQFTYLWNFGDPLSGINNSSTAINPLHQYSAVGPFTVHLQIISGAGCVQDTAIIVNSIHPQPKADFTISNAAICLGTPIVFIDASTTGGAPISSWHWLMGDGGTGNAPLVTHQYTATGNYSVSLHIINAFGCNSDTVVKPIVVYPYPVVSAGADLFVLEGNQVSPFATATGNLLQYLWTPNVNIVNNNNTVLVPVFKGIADITYTLTVTAEGGCAVSDAVFVKVLKAPLIPNTFTPNNDGINDIWLIQYLNDYPNCRVQVFTRTGQLVYSSSKGYANPWNGTKNGKFLPMDTYYYIIEPGNGRMPFTGFVTIVK